RRAAARDGARPRHERVLGLGHAHVAEDAPREGADEQHPRTLARLGEVARGVVRGGDEMLVVLLLRHGITPTASPSEMRVAPWTTTCSPSLRPLRTGISLPRNSPSSTSRRCAVVPSRT